MTSAKAVSVLLVCALAACGSGGDGGNGGGGSGSVCPGATAFEQTTTSNATLDGAQVIATGGKPVTLFAKDGGQLSGWFKFTGLAAGQSVEVQIVEAQCAKTGCADTFDFTLTDENGDDLVSQSDGTCGSKTITADSAGTVHAAPAGGGSGGEGLGLLVTPK